MRVCVFGAGSLGSAIGGLLAVRNDVTLIGRNPHISVTRKKGLRFLGDVRRRVTVDARNTISGLEPPRLVIITTKAYDTAEAVSVCRDWAGVGTKVLTLQNGLGNLEILRAWKGSDALGGTTTMGAQLLSPGIVRISGLGMTALGADMDRAFAEEVARCFTSCGLPARVVEDIRGELWSKAAVSACINPLTAILRVPNGKLLESDTLMNLISGVCRECAMAARSEGVRLSSREIERRVLAVASDTRGNRSSMLRDVENGRMTEVGQINGAFVSMGERHGVPSPLNKALTAMVASLALRGAGKG